MTMFTDLVEKLMQHFTQGVYEPEVIRAKEDFYKVVGAFDEESPEIEQKIAQFSDWYLFTRQLTNKNVTPVQHFLNQPEFALTDEQKPLLEGLRSARHSVFEFSKVKGSEVHLKDLFSGESIIVASAAGGSFDKEAFFETRLFPIDNVYYFGSTFCFHPPEAGKYIKKEIKKLKKVSKESFETEKELLIDRLFRMRNKYDQYRHVGLKEIYSNESKLRV
jgi:hypothetical protein